jgi:hypothetical protein
MATMRSRGNQLPRARALVKLPLWAVAIGPGAKHSGEPERRAPPVAA